MAKHYKENNNKIFVLSMLRIMFFILLVISLAYIIKWNSDNKQNEIIEEEVSEAVRIENDAGYKIDFEKLKDINKNTVAWLKVNGTEIEYAVVQSSNNNYYLNHNFENKYNKAGWVFADYKNKFDETDKNIVIYGHNRKDGSMFGTLKNVLQEEWYNNEENNILTLITEKGEHKYRVFSIYEIKNEDYYIDTEFTDDEFENFIETLKKRSIKDFNAEISSEDSILTLSTCGDNNTYRVVIHAKKI